MYKKLLEIFDVLTTPNCWVQLYRYSEAWDKELNTLMLTHKFERQNQYYAKIGKYNLWIENHPYASFSLRFPSKVLRPSRATILKAGRKLKADSPDYSDAALIKNYE